MELLAIVLIVFLIIILTVYRLPEKPIKRSRNTKDTRHIEWCGGNVIFKKRVHPGNEIRTLEDIHGNGR